MSDLVRDELERLTWHSSHPARKREERRQYMKLSEAVKIAVSNNDSKRVGQIADQLRNQGFRYADILDFAQRNVPGLTSARWEALLLESEG